ncbi:DUF4328 domain-containing protein [Cellulosimicrobium sp. BIT-GX5]|uniref:DUF4328 domain-containing protein n=1 Tax=Cellulosimicrobium composti TaxID=2672572 RepID=A0A6N7ZMT9_9MICO|nr:DUF4328 domain-containing protein [Cellulosimicrobium composti]MTG90603.1 DUF4328 domain-containing protein [Cellulosimicrobium composti]
MTAHDPYGVPPHARPSGDQPGPPAAPGPHPPVPVYGQHAPAPAYGQPAPAYGQHTPAPVYGRPAPAYGQYAPVPPPAYGAPGSWSGWAPRPPVPGSLATATVALAILVTAVQAIVWLTSFAAAGDFASAAREGTASVDVVTAYDGTSFLLLPFQVAAGVVTCVWLWQSRTFAEAVSPGARHARSRVWVWLAWFVPVVSLWFPYQVVRDVRAATTSRPRPGLGWWWAGWLTFSVASNLAAQLTTLTTAGPAETFVLLPVLETAATVGVVLALVFWVRTVRETTAAQRAFGADGQR